MIKKFGSTNCTYQVLSASDRGGYFMDEHWNHQVHKVVVVGSSGGGKTALILRFIHGEFLETSETSKAEYYEKKVRMVGEEVYINILDTSGKTVPTSVRKAYYTGGEGFLVVFSISDEQSFITAQKLREDIIRVKVDKKTPIVLIGNKCDVESGRKVSRQDASKLANEWKVQYLETSAKTGQNVQKAFLDIARSIEAKKEVLAEMTSRSCCQIL